MTARVVVNRAWQQLFGKGLVETENDFGMQGSLPSHPELLDWLAVDFRENGWSVKKLLRTIVTSETYKQSSVVRPDDASKDPTNKWLARQTRLRLEAEIIRDAAIDGAKARFRPILMTGLAFVCGVLPMVIANGAGANTACARRQAAPPRRPPPPPAPPMIPL